MLLSSPSYKLQLTGAKTEFGHGVFFTIGYYRTYLTSLAYHQIPSIAS